MDLPIIGYKEGTGRLKGMLGAFVLNYKGNEVEVGSGFTDEQRTIYWRLKYEIAGMLCEVKYKGISSDKNTGLESLQFPVFVQLRKEMVEQGGISEDIFSEKEYEDDEVGFGFGEDCAWVNNGFNNADLDWRIIAL